MSRSINTERTPNPAKRFLQWDSDSKQFSYWDKELPNAANPEKKGAKVFIPLPFQFLVLDTLHTMSGFSDADSAGYYANEIRDTKKERISLKMKGKEVINGLYEDIKGKCNGSRYAQSVYIAFFDKDAAGNKSLVIGNIKMEGASLGSWIDFCSGRKITEGAIKVATSKYVEKNKKVNWNEPVFEAINAKPETDAKAIELDGVLQAYLTEYFNAAKVETTPVSEMNVVDGANKSTYNQAEMAAGNTHETPAFTAMMNEEPVAQNNAIVAEDEDF